MTEDTTDRVHCGDMGTDAGLEFLCGFSLGSFLKYVEAEERSLMLKVVTDGAEGFLFFIDGNLVDAGCNGERGEGAAIEILTWDHTDIYLEVIDRGPSPTIQTSVTNLLLEASRMKDDADSDAAYEAALLKAIRLVEAHRFIDGAVQLKRLLAQRSDDAVAWLWYSRCVTVFDVIEHALESAIGITPEAPEVLEEIAKCNRAKADGPLNRIRRCPICWTALDVNARECVYCGAFLFIEPNFIPPETSTPTVQLLEEAVRRYTRVEPEKANLNAIFFLGMAYYNLGQLRDAVTPLEQAVALSEEAPFFTEQYHRLLQLLDFYPEEQTVAL